MKAIKITNTHWLQQLAPQIEEYAKKVKVPGLYGVNLATHFHGVIQFGGEMSEFWVAFGDDNGPVAFASWAVMGPPFIGAVILDHGYRWGDSKDATSLLAKEFVNFGARKNATIYHTKAINKTVARRDKQLLKAQGVEFVETSAVYMTGKKQ